MEKIFHLIMTSSLVYRYLYNESINLQSVMTALTTLYAAHKYMCPGLAKEVSKGYQINFRACCTILSFYIYETFIMNMRSIFLFSGGFIYQKQLDREERFACATTHMSLLPIINGLYYLQLLAMKPGFPPNFLILI